MKNFSLLLTFILITSQVDADIAPSPIAANGVCTTDSCNIQMTCEYVYADLYQNYAKVECTFELLNFGDSITIQIGFPEMHFQYHHIGIYNKDEKINYTIEVDGKMLTERDIKMSKELDSAVTAYKKNYKLGNEIYRYIEAGNYPWYVWDVHFDKNEKKQIKVAYTLPAGKGVTPAIVKKSQYVHKSTNFKYFKYILETGSGWYGPIGRANIELKLHNIGLKTIEDISPAGYQLNEKTKRIKWEFLNLEPTREDNIYVRYFNRADRRRFEKKKNQPISKETIEF